MDAMIAALRDLRHELGDHFPLVISGGLGLHIKQSLLLQSNQPTLFARDAWPVSRSTEDIDLLLHAEIATNASRMRDPKIALDRLGFEPVESARFYQFAKSPAEGRPIKIDLLTGPLDEREDLVPRDPRRVKPQPPQGIHARRTPEAIGVEEAAIAAGFGAGATLGLLLPNALTFALMKLGALTDQIDDDRRDRGRHHALDLYRCVAMLTPEEDAAAARLRVRYREHPSLIAGRSQVERLLGPAHGPGRIRLLEHQLRPRHIDLDRFVKELRALLSPP